LPRPPQLPLLAILLLTVVLSGLSRCAQSRAVHLAGAPGWITTDPDSHYHMRRVDRALVEGLPVAAEDDFLDFPNGSAIPWPPYATYVAWGLLSPFAPDEASARRAFVEEGVASLALVFGLLTTLVASLAGAALAGRAGAVVAGSYHALCAASIVYSRLGNGDHHSLVSFLSGAILLVVGAGFARGALEERGTALRWGIAAGALVGILLGTWVGGMMLLVALELALGWLVLRQHRDGRAGLAAYGLAFHLAALATLAPAVLASPWKETQPWMLVNLSWFHFAFLLAGAAVFAPLPFLRGKATRAWPWIIAALLLVVGVTIATAELSLARSVREGFAWASRTNEFMAGIRESRSLFASGAEPGASELLGYPFWLLPLAWGAAAWRAFGRGELGLLPWVVATPLVLLQAVQQARFAEGLVLPMAVLLGWGAGVLFEREGEGSLARAARALRRLPPLATGTGAVLLVALCHASSSVDSLQGLARPAPRPVEQEGPTRIAVRQALEWLREHSPAPSREGGPPDYGVLANWSHGHAIEWAAERPSIATNFGSYVGEEGFRFPARFFLSEDPREARELLAARRVRYVLATSQLPDHLNAMIAQAAPERRARWVDPAVEGKVEPAWFRTMGARLMFDGAVFLQDQESHLGFLRLVYVSPIPDPARRLRAPTDVAPAAWIWERVEGAQVEAWGTPGTMLRISVDVHYPGVGKLLRWRGSAVADERGRAMVRVPYATRGGGGGQRPPRARWRFGNFDGELELSDAAARDGARILVHGSP